MQYLESEAVQGRFRAVYEKINLALDGMPYSEIGISDEVKEQVRFLARSNASRRGQINL